MTEPSRHDVERFVRVQERFAELIDQELEGRGLLVGEEPSDEELEACATAVLEKADQELTDTVVMNQLSSEWSCGREPSATPTSGRGRRTLGRSGARAGLRRLVSGRRPAPDGTSARNLARNGVDPATPGETERT
jgi:hypothetical protein